ncbi:hypothetical protein [Pseudomonas sp. gcc21]|uniref:hypothetical protein n=1 Tax=Pseudomonas sp. gcc21 TaxID=2726989 RepID=UPI001C49AC49|nr:hypothetical protein [Pseudomonas sp. gcc21]
MRAETQRRGVWNKLSKLVFVKQQALAFPGVVSLNGAGISEPEDHDGRGMSLLYALRVSATPFEQQAREHGYEF